MMCRQAGNKVVLVDELTVVIGQDVIIVSQEKLPEWRPILSTYRVAAWHNDVYVFIKKTSDQVK
jgi:hypothetical protein